MNREDFMSFVEKNIKFHLPESFATCRFEAGKQMCLIVSEGNSPDAIRLHLEEVYDTFTEDRNIFSALDFIAKNVEEAWSVTGKMDETKEQLRGYINNYEEAKKHLQIILSDPDVESVLANSVVTQVCPHRRSIRPIRRTLRRTIPRGTAFTSTACCPRTRFRALSSRL